MDLYTVKASCKRIACTNNELLLELGHLLLCERVRDRVWRRGAIWKLLHHNRSWQAFNELQRSVSLEIETPLQLLQCKVSHFAFLAKT